MRDLDTVVVHVASLRLVPAKTRSITPQPLYTITL